MSKKSALLLGATGATGRHVLRELLSNPEFGRVGEYGRRVTSKDQLGPEALTDKLEQKVIDFEKLDEAGLKNGKWDVVYVTLGTSRAAAGSAAAFERIDREYVINASRAAKSVDPSHKQRLVYLSSAGANASSPLLYPKSKGLTENSLASLGYSDTIVFRPGFLDSANRENRRTTETLIAPFVAIAKCLSNDIAIDVPILAKAIAKAGTLGSENLPSTALATKTGPAGSQFTLIGNRGALQLAKSA